VFQLIWKTISNFSFAVNSKHQAKPLNRLLVSDVFQARRHVVPPLLPYRNIAIYFHLLILFLSLQIIPKTIGCTDCMYFAGSGLCCWRVVRMTWGVAVSATRKLNIDQYFTNKNWEFL
jgi:hypothetical protein